MVVVKIEKRELNSVGDAIWRAVDIFERNFHGILTHDSMHGEGVGDKSTTWIFTFPENQYAQIALRMNKAKLTMYIRATSVDGQDMARALVGHAKIEKTYTNPKAGPPASLLGGHARFLNPSSSRPLLRIVPKATSINLILSTYLGDNFETDIVTGGRVSGDENVISLDNLTADFNRAVQLSVDSAPAERQRRLNESDPLPARIAVTSTVFLRNPDVVAEVLLRARGNCESCGAPAPFKRASDGTPYLEVHHILPLAKNGKDTVDNAEALCPNCHRQKHFGMVS